MTATNKTPDYRSTDRDRNGNENCLKGFECPKCGHCRLFYIEAVRRLTVALCDDGATDEGGATEYGGESVCGCSGCGHSGTVSDFQFQKVPMNAEQIYEELYAAAEEYGFVSDEADEHLWCVAESIAGHPRGVEG